MIFKNQSAVVLSIFTFLAIFACTSSTDVEEEAEVEVTTDYYITPVLTMFDNIDAITYALNGITVTFTTTDVPNHTSPYF